jgi:hypothetical protein
MPELRQPLQPIIAELPDTEVFPAIAAAVNAACGVEPGTIPSDRQTYGWREILAELGRQKFKPVSIVADLGKQTTIAGYSRTP